MPPSILVGNTTPAVARLLGEGRRQRTRDIAELQPRYLFHELLGRPGKVKGEDPVGYALRNSVVPNPSFESFEAHNAYQEWPCLERIGARLRGHSETTGQRPKAGPRTTESSGDTLMHPFYSLGTLATFLSSFLCSSSASPHQHSTAVIPPDSNPRL